MAFSRFIDLDSAAAELGLNLLSGDLLADAKPVAPPEWLSEMLDFHFARRARSFSEMYAREFLIAPLFSYALRQYSRLNLFCNDFPLRVDSLLSGTPDYLLSYPRIENAYDSASQYPLLAVAEAKRDDFNAGWAQCAAELYACQLMNQRAGTNGSAPLWGVVSNGLLWEFGRLEASALTIHPHSMDARPLGDLLGALVYVFADCLRNGERIAG